MFHKQRSPSLVITPPVVVPFECPKMVTRCWSHWLATDSFPLEFALRAWNLISLSSNGRYPLGPGLVLTKENNKE